jgi:hypothetical protein
VFASINQCGSKRSLAYIIEVAVEVLEVHIEVHKIALAQFMAQAVSTFGAGFSIFLNLIDFVRLVQSLHVW